MTYASLDGMAASLLGDHPHPGALYGVGLGPGDPGLLTLRGAALLQRLDIVATPRSERGRGIARGIVEGLVEPERLLELASAMPVDSAAVLDGWRERIAPLLAALHEGASVGFVTDGDPSLYSTFAYAAAALLELRPDTPVFVVPGVTAMSAAAAVEGRPLVLGAERLAVLPMVRVDDDALRTACDVADTVVLLKAGGSLPRVDALVRSHARGWTVQVVRRVGLADEESSAGIEGVSNPDDYMTTVILRRPGTFTAQLAETRSLRSARP
ncbi:MAG TPA: precorrin-2 C(20)-methyltransferase [Candidatus Dormibacteraeota bacterium]|nr:precorrin-2 C(20)-methyltransferase [Candidatus Dormibacteraeota bacterium]